MFGHKINSSQIQVHGQAAVAAVAVAGSVAGGGVSWVGCAPVFSTRGAPDRGDMGEGIVKRGGNGDGGERASAKRLERDRDGHRRRRKSRREAERAVRPRRHSIAVDLAVEPALSEGRGVDAADPGLELVVALPERPRAALRREAWFL